MTDEYGVDGRAGWVLLLLLLRLVVVVVGFVGLAVAPVGAGDVLEDHGLAGAQRGLERQLLVRELVVILPVRAPVLLHLEPRAVRALDVQRHHVSIASHVVHQHDVEVGVPVDREPNSSAPHALHPAHPNPHPNPHPNHNIARPNSNSNSNSNSIRSQSPHAVTTLLDQIPIPIPIPFKETKKTNSVLGMANIMEEMEKTWRNCDELERMRGGGGGGGGVTSCTGWG